MGEVGTIKFAEEEVNRIGGNINKAIDRIHDTDHGVRICNKEAGSGSHGVCFTAGKCRCGTVCSLYRVAAKMFHQMFRFPVLALAEHFKIHFWNLAEPYLDSGQ